TMSPPKNLKAFLRKGIKKSQILAPSDTGSTKDSPDPSPPPPPKVKVFQKPPPDSLFGENITNNEREKYIDVDNCTTNDKHNSAMSKVKVRSLISESPQPTSRKVGQNP